jgi:hypothetical protein
MFLVIRDTDNRIMLSSARPLDEKQYVGQGMSIVEIPDSEYDPAMVGGILHHD